MGGTNAFFKLDIRDNNVFLKTFPPKDGGEVLKIKDVTAYLESKGYDTYNLKEVNRAITDRENNNEVLIGPWAGSYVNEEMVISVSLDKMLVFCRFYPPSNEGKMLTQKDFIDEINRNKITTGIIKENVQLLMKKRRYCKDYVIAKGIPPKQGTDAKVEYFFNTHLNTKPKANEDGTVNYKDLDVISHVEEGQLLAKLIKEVPGKPGKNVFGQSILPRQVKANKLEFANNINLSEDRTQIFAAVAGHASLVDEKVFVSNVYDVPADVDNTTGDISYDGNIMIKGNIKAGFTVAAKGDIIVEGVIEGAIVTAKGNVIVKHGIRGMGKGKVEAGGDVVTKNIENAFVYAGGSVDTGSVLHSTVSAGEEIKIQGKKGFASGGTIRAGKLIEAQTIGSDMGALTKIEVGVDPKVKERYAALRKENVEAEKEIEQIQPILVNFNERMAKKEKVLPSKVKQIQELAGTFKQRKEQIENNKQEMDQLYQEIQANSDARIKVRGTIFPGAEITISDLHLYVKEQRSFSQFLVEKGDITIRPL